MEGFITYNPLDPFDGPKASDDPPPVYNKVAWQDRSPFPAIQNPTFPGSAVYSRTQEDQPADASLKISGQGVVTVRAQPQNLLVLLVTVPSVDAGNGIALVVTHTSCDIYWIDGQGGLQKFSDDLFTEKNPKKDKWYLKNYETNYWLSFDLPHGAIKYGIGLQTVQTQLFEIRLKTFDKGAGIWTWASNWEWMAGLEDVKARLGKGDKSKLLLAVTALPIVNDLPPLIRSGDQVSLTELSSGLFTVPANLPVECQHLYNNVAGVNITLDTPDFPDFSSAIEHSVNTPGGYAYNLLQHKVGELGSDILGTYLRITIGTDLGNSPGIPYVLEIWPAGHYSPIHDHGDAYAVIKVLHGAIECTYYDALREQPAPNPLYPNPTVLCKGDVTWLGKEIYQVHRLRNLSTAGKVCCTVQCYQYGDKDTTHYEAFRYLKEEGSLKEVEDFQPNSDADLATFKTTIWNEWKNVLSGKPLCKDTKGVPDGESVATTVDELMQSLE
ncbi:hypothetical protein CYLTODRAFT_441230 [Cylindrobasidium torrendii FP15055 ss-10]|uniref:cysteine dioxygenase n=1 Tax=Cylindrobasidium torrendii FP15055 ss-10 TaxID=1314674 RepID=A0A0D7BPQ2_9AGAR|nr:hypothetical protein CYLTODRAFT_441230 [Cylindrobasidium torrendii FP15055 ss-10]